MSGQPGRGFVTQQHDGPPAIAQGDLVGYLEIMEATGVRRPVVTMWRSRHEDFPPPLAELKIGPIWWWPHIEAWLVRTGRPYTSPARP